MSGTLEGGRKAAATNKAKYGKEFYANIGRKGGSKSHPETRPFALNPELAKRCGRNGGKKSKRGPAKRGGRVINANYTKDQLERIREELSEAEQETIKMKIRLLSTELERLRNETTQ